MVSSIDATKPADGSASAKSDLRANLQTAKDEVGGLQDDIATIANPSSISSVIPSSALHAVGQGATPYHFVPDPAFIGQRAGRKLNADYATEAEARTAYPEVADLLPDGTDISTVTHDWSAFQSMSRAALKNGNGVPDQYVPAGVYDFSDTWKITEGEDFCTATVLGAGRGKGDSFNSNAQLSQTCLRAEFGDRPLVSIQGGRHVEFGRFTLQGINTSGSYAPGKLASKDPSLWSVGEPTISEGRYNPYVAIAVDPYTTAPTNGDPQYPNDSYGRRTTSQANLHNLHLQWFYVGFGAGLSNDGSLGDGITLEKVDCNGVTYGCVSGGSQNRILSYNEGYMEGGFRCFDGRTFGTQNGNAFQVRNLVMVLYYELFRYRQVDPVTFENVHAEQFVRLGDWAGGPQQFPLTMRNGHIKFWGDLEGDIHKPSSHLNLGGGRVVFDACRFDTVPSSSSFFPGHFNFVGRDTADILFTNKCTFYQSALQTGRPVIGFTRLNGNPPKHEGTIFNSGRAGDTLLQPRFGGLDDIQNLSNSVSEGLRAGGRVGGGPRTHTIHVRGEATYRFVPGTSAPGYAIPGLSNVSIDTVGTTFNSVAITYRELTFDTTEPELFFPNDDLAARLIEGSPAEGTIAYVLDVTGSTVRAYMTCDDTEVVDPITSLQLIAGSEWAPKEALTGDCTSGSPNITFSRDASDIVFPGDYIQASDGTWQRYRVLSVAGDGLSAVLTKNAGVTATGTNWFWARLFEITGTAV